MQKRRDAMMEANYGASLAEVAEGVQMGNAQALEEMYRRILPGLRAFLAMRVPKDLVDDYSHDIFMALVKFIGSGSVRDPHCLPGIIRTIAHRFVSEGRKARNTELTPFDSEDLERHLPDQRSDLEFTYQRKQQLDVALATLALLKDNVKPFL